MLEGLDRVDWSKLQHAYGSAEDVPALLRALDSAESKERDGAFHALYGNIFHQGTRYAATPHAIPFLVELVSQPAPKSTAELLGLIVHCVAGYFSVSYGPAHTTGPVWGGGSPPMSDYGEDDKIRAACEDAAAPVIPAALRLLHDREPDVRASAAWLLAALRKFSTTNELVPRLADRLAAEPEAQVRAMRVFAIGHLAPLGDDQELSRAFDDASPLVRTLAAMLWACRARTSTPPRVVETLLASLTGAEAIDDEYTSLPFAPEGLAGDLGSVLGALGPGPLASALPALTAKLGTVEGFEAVGLLHGALGAAFGEARVTDARLLTPPQRTLLETLAKNQAFWSIGNAMNVLLDHGLPSMREQMAEFLGIQVETDPVETLRISARSFGAFGPERALAAWLEVLTAAPNDPEATAAAGSLLVATEKYEQGLALLDHAIAAGAASGEVLFQRGSALFQLGRLEDAVAAFEAAQPRLDGESAGLAHRNRIAILQRLGRTAEALVLEEELGSPDESDAEAWLHRGLAQVKAGRYDDCIASIRRVIAVDPADATAQYTIACAYCLRGDVASALASIKAAIDANPDYADAIAADTDFASIKDDPRFRALVGL
jgi:tetratricopeptide (TPR) repeat protein